MALAPILLGLLETPASGYDLRKLFEETVQHFWRAELSQIYPTLHRLNSEGLVKMSASPSPRGPERKVYSRTRAGTAVLRRWLREEPQLGTERHTYLAQLFFLAELHDPDATRRFVETLRSHFAARLAVLRTIDDAHRNGAKYPPDLDAETLPPYLTLLFGLRRIEATVEWCDEALRLLDRLIAEREEET